MREGPAAGFGHLQKGPGSKGEGGRQRAGLIVRHKAVGEIGYCVSQKPLGPQRFMGVVVFPFEVGPGVQDTRVPRLFSGC